jgi:hypothetical protein
MKRKKRKKRKVDSASSVFPRDLQVSRATPPVPPPVSLLRVNPLRVSPCSGEYCERSSNHLLSPPLLPPLLSHRVPPQVLSNRRDCPPHLRPDLCPGAPVAPGRGGGGVGTSPG